MRVDVGADSLDELGFAVAFFRLRKQGGKHLEQIRAHVIQRGLADQIPVGIIRNDAAVLGRQIQHQPLAGAEELHVKITHHLRVGVLFRQIGLEFEQLALQFFCVVIAEGTQHGVFDFVGIIRHRMVADLPEAAYDAFAAYQMHAQRLLRLPVRVGKRGYILERTRYADVDQHALLTELPEQRLRGQQNGVLRKAGRGDDAGDFVGRGVQPDEQAHLVVRKELLEPLGGKAALFHGGADEIKRTFVFRRLEIEPSLLGAAGAEIEQHALKQLLVAACHEVFLQFVVEPFVLRNHVVDPVEHVHVGISELFGNKVNGMVKLLGDKPRIQNADRHHAQEDHENPVANFIKPGGKPLGILRVDVNPIHFGIARAVDVQLVVIDGALHGHDGVGERLRILHKQIHGVGFSDAADERPLRVKNHQAAVVAQHDVGKSRGNDGVFQIDDDVVCLFAAGKGGEGERTNEGHYVGGRLRKGTGDGTDIGLKRGKGASLEAEEKIPVVIK